MPRHDIAPPANWEDFEDLCLDLWRLLWVDPKARKHGRRGQKQAGVDVYGQPKGGAAWEGVQCKLKSQILGKKLTRKEIEAEVAKARIFTPRLASFTIATTALRDSTIEAVVREVSKAQQEVGFFRVNVAFWEDILEDIERLEEDHHGLLIRHVRAWKRLERQGGTVSGIAGVPKLPPHYIERPEYLEPLKRAVLDQVADKLGITGKGTVGVQGMGGIGKTVLAAALARDEDVRRAFADGVLWVTVGQQPDLLSLQAELAAAAGHPELVFASIHQGKRELELLLADRETLVVADDVWKVEHAAAFDVVGAAGRLVVTTRNSDVIVALGATEHRLDVLEPAQALAFLADWSGRSVRELPEVAARVAKACGYLPLALAMIGAMVQHRPTGWDDALARLGRADLDKIRRDFADYPYPDLLRALEVSVDALEPDDRERYLELAVFREDEMIPEAALATLWSAGELDDLDARDLVHRLAACSLASVVDDGGLMLHDLQRDYVRNRAARSLTVLHQRLLDAYERRCDEGWASGPDDGYYFQRLPYHLIEARRSGELRALLLEIGWLRAKLEAAGVAALISDYNLLPERKDLRQVQGALRLAAHVLVQHPQQLAGQLLGRLRRDPEALGIDTLIKAARTGGEEQPILFTAPAVSLLPRAATLTAPGGPLERILEGHTDFVTAVAALADGRIVSGSFDGTLRVWDSATGAALLATHKGSAIYAVAALVDGRIVSGSFDGTLRVWDPATGAALATLEGHSGPVTTVATLANGHIVSGSGDGTLRVWNPTSAAALATLQGHSDAITALAAFADGRVVSGSGDGTLRVWDPAGGAVLATLRGHTRRVKAVAALADGRVVSGSADGTLRVWDPASGEALATLQGHGDEVFAVAVLTDDRVVSGSADGTLRVWDPASGDALATFEGHSGAVYAVTALVDGRVVSGSADGTLRVWDPASATGFATLDGHSSWVTAVAALADGRVVSGSDDGTLRVWDPASAATVATLDGHIGAVYAVAALADGRVVSGSDDGTLQVWDTASRAVLVTLEGHSGGVTAVVALADSRVVSGSFDGTLRVWDPASGEAVATLEGHSRGVTAVAALAYGRVVSGSGDRMLRVWDPASGLVLASLEGHSGRITALATLTDGRVVSGSDDGTLRVWDPASGEAVAILKGHSDWVTAVAALADGRVVSASFDRTLRVWDMQSSQLLAVFTLDAIPETVAFDARGGVIAGDRSGRLHFFDVVEKS